MEEKIWRQLGIIDSEYYLIKEGMGREPNFLELSLFSAMWSEHCGYKNSKPLFKHFPTTGKRVLQGPGENAGIVDIGDGLAITMKVESHNHPSAIAPFEGAATGAGGIIRDILAVGSEPIALLNSLHFGKIEENARNRFLLREVVHGIGEYGNCVGIPTVGGEVKFDDAYTANPLVNAMCVGLLREEDIKKAVATGIGNSVLIVGNWTGKDGVGGAAFASKELHEESEEERSAVQVGDPFMEKLLIDACLEAFKKDYVIGVQDLGAAGLISSTSETAYKAGTGMEIDVALVPQREDNMEPWQVMLSESQERMLLIVEKGEEDKVNKIFHRWDLHAVKIGEVIADPVLRVSRNGKVLGEVPVNLLNEPPLYTREGVIPKINLSINKSGAYSVPAPENYEKAILKIIGDANISSREWVYRQYDQMVKTNTVIPPGGDAGVVRIKGTSKAVALTMDSRGKYCYLNPYRGSEIVICEAARNLVAQGAEPVAVTDGLNFGNPEKLEIYWQLEESIKGLSSACKALDIPVISGNASLYNEAGGDAIYPTPIIGMAGLIEEIDKIVDPAFKDGGDAIIVVGETFDEFGGSVYLEYVKSDEVPDIPELDLDKEKKTQKTMLRLIREGLVKSAHDISDGGLIAALLESAIFGGKGAKIDLNTAESPHILLFSESQSRFLITVKPENTEKIIKNFSGVNIIAEEIGRVGGDAVIIKNNNKIIAELSLTEVKDKYENYLPEIMNQ